MRCCVDTTDGGIRLPILTKDTEDATTVRSSRKYLVAAAGYIILLLNGSVVYTGGVFVPEFLEAFPEAHASLVSLIVSVILGTSAFASKLLTISFSFFFFCHLATLS